MGLAISQIWKNWFAGKEMRILMLGLDAAGKSVITYRLKLGEVVQSIPTVGFNVEAVQYKNINMTIWDVGGQDKIRPLWRHYYHNTQALIYVVDSNDVDRLDDTKGCQHSAMEELHHLLSDTELKEVPLLVFANKQDLPHAVKVDVLIRKLRLHQIKDRKWYIQGSCALTGEGLCEGLEWLSNSVKG